ncbi:MAG: hypothetical protein Q9167_001985 [Letrouitia subvulpina]
MRFSLLALPLFVLPFACADWTIDFYQNATECKADGRGEISIPPDYPGNMTLAGGHDGIKCAGGAVYKNGGKDSNAIVLKGIKSSGMMVHMYTAEGCPSDSYHGSTYGDTIDGCYVNGDIGRGPYNYVTVAKPL